MSVNKIQGVQSEKLIILIDKIQSFENKDCWLIFYLTIFWSYFGSDMRMYFHEFM